MQIKRLNSILFGIGALTFLGLIFVSNPLLIAPLVVLSFIFGQVCLISAVDKPKQIEK